MERRKIWTEAVKQAERLAALYDQSGVMFNVGPVTIQEDGTVISQEALRRREERKAAKATAEAGTTQDTVDHTDGGFSILNGANSENGIDSHTILHPSRANNIPSESQHVSKTQQRKLAALAPRPAPPKPLLPDSIELPEGEENWISLWDLSNDQLERRIRGAKKKKANARKELRTQQKSGKVERRAARDKKRAVYRYLKQTWKEIKSTTAHQIN